MYNETFLPIGFPLLHHREKYGQTKSLIFLSNFKECNLVQKFIIHDIEEKYKGQIKFVDTSDIMSQRTKHFLNISSNIFMNTHGNLWAPHSTTAQVTTVGAPYNRVPSHRTINVHTCTPWLLRPSACLLP